MEHVAGLAPIGYSSFGVSFSTVYTFDEPRRKRLLFYASLSNDERKSVQHSNIDRPLVQFLPTMEKALTANIRPNSVKFNSRSDVELLRQIHVASLGQMILFLIPDADINSFPR